MEERIITTISIDGKPISTFSNLMIRQSFNSHHFFELYVNHDTFENLGDYRPNNSKGHIGKQILVTITETLSRAETLFAGVICEVAMEQSHGMHGELVLRGYSPTILMDYGPVLQSYMAKSLSEIVQKSTMKMVSNDLNMKIEPKFTKKINYMVQYKESTFSFLNRLSAEYGEWFYYDGQNTYFGRPKEQKEINLTYGREISAMNWSMKVSPVNFSQYSYNSDNDYIHETNAPSTEDSDNDNGFAAAASGKMFSEDINIPIKPRVQDQQELGELIAARKAAATADLVALVAKTSSPAVMIGGIANIKVSKKGILDFVTEDYGKYLLTSIVHEVDGNGRYRNTIEGIPALNEVIPVKQARYPVAEAQVATVKYNNDPMNMGRVKVELLWQKPLNETTDWVRVLTPDAGSSDLISVNRGYVFVPEVGDQVIVGFRYNDPNRPFIMGSIFHGKTAGGGLEKNHMKSITTRTGHLVEFDDSEENHGIKITDKNSNIIHIDTKGNNITVTANETMTFNAKNMKINVAENMDMQIGQNMTTNAGENIKVRAVQWHELSAKDIKEKAEASITVQSKKHSNTSDDVRVVSSVADLQMFSGKSIVAKSTEKSKLF